VPPGGGPGAEPRVEIVLGAVTGVPSAAGRPGQERGRHGEALLGPLVGAVAERRRVVPTDRRWRSRRQRRNRSSSWRCPASPMASSLAAAQRWKPARRRSRGGSAPYRTSSERRYHGAARPEGIQGGVAAGHAVMGQVPQGFARYRAAAQPYHAALRAVHRHQPVGQRPQLGRHLSAGPGEGIGDQPGEHAPPAAPALARGDLAAAAAAEAGGDAAAAGAGRLPGRVQARQRGEGAAAAAGAGAQPGLQVAVLADSPLRPAVGAAGVALAAARTGPDRAGAGAAAACRC
jgi:hypothetical protein